LQNSWRKINEEELVYPGSLEKWLIKLRRKRSGTESHWQDIHDV